MKIDVKICCKCGRDIRASLACPEPNYMAERNGDSYADAEDCVECSACGEVYDVDIMNSFGGADVSVTNSDVEVHHDVPYFDDDETDEWYWQTDAVDSRKILADHLDAATKLLVVPTDEKTRFMLQVMVYGHVVAAIEGFLASAFIRTTVDNDDLIRKLIETESRFSEMRFSMSQIFKQQEQIKETVSKYLHGLIFHRLNTIKPMYKNVLGHDFGDIAWLSRAVKKRHDCVHRAGYTVEGDQVLFEKNEIEDLIKRIQGLSNGVLDSINKLGNEAEGIPF